MNIEDFHKMDIPDSVKDKVLKSGLLFFFSFKKHL